MERHESTPCLQKPLIGPYPEPVTAYPAHRPTLKFSFRKTHVTIIPPPPINGY
jgi:hypothetical protein